MKKISFKIQVIVLASLALLFSLTILFSPLFTSTFRVERHDSGALFGSSLKSSLINQITLYQKEMQVSLSKEKEVWQVVYPQKRVAANQSLIESFLSDMKGLKSGRLVEKKSKDFTPYDLDEGSAVRIELHDIKDNSFVLYVGKEDSSYQRRFVRLESSDKIYETKVPSSFVSLQRKEWADLKLFASIDSSTNRPIQMSFVGEDPFKKADAPLFLNYQLVLQADSEDAKKNEWKIIDSDEKISQYEVEQIIKKITTASGYDYCFADQDLASLGLKNPIATLSVTANNGLVKSLSIGKKVEGQERFYCLLSPLNEVMEVSQATLESLLKSKSTLLQP